MVERPNCHHTVVQQTGQSVYEMPVKSCGGHLFCSEAIQQVRLLSWAQYYG